MQYLINPSLPLLIDDWPGNPIKGDQFQYPGRGFRPKWSNIAKMVFHSNPQRREKKEDRWRPSVVRGHDYLQDKNDNWIVWLGHACFLIQLGGIRIITDPVFYDLPLIPRKVHLPFDPKVLQGIDYLLLSHDHRDHCDARSFKVLLQNNQVHILSSLRMGTVIQSWIGPTPLQEAGWYQTYQTQEEGLRISYLPAQHWCRRGLTDFNLRLWGSFMIEYDGYCIYFGADSASGPHFEQIGQLFQIDLALLGIGAYKPAFMMSDNHTSPSEAQEAFQQLGAKKMIPMHYGTYDLSNEPISEPLRLIQECFQEKGQQSQLLRPGVNEVVEL
ncbi:MAG: MBL fold metallo-hydrolase [Bacteroidota bacterium]